MKLSQILEDVQLFHGGNEIAGKKFKMDYSGSGEGENLLGPGTYFSDVPEGAMAYLHHAPNRRSATLTTATIDDSRIVRQTSKEFYEAGEKIAKELGFDSHEELRRSAKHVSFMIEPIKSIVGTVGRSKARELFIKYGIDGVFEKLPSGSTEYVIYNPSVITDVKKVKLSQDQIKRYIDDPNQERIKYKRQRMEQSFDGKSFREWLNSNDIENAIVGWFDDNQFMFDSPDQFFSKKTLGVAETEAYKRVLKKHEGFPRKMFHLLFTALMGYDKVKKRISEILDNPFLSDKEWVMTSIKDELGNLKPWELEKLKKQMDHAPRRTAQRLSKEWMGMGNLSPNRIKQIADYINQL